ncbi:MAG: tRNA (N6-isopentenyl adenosine(37)-C2)-methylthiotransferase MiaB [candidate division Zixibacteria bacterium]|nr:tRNA (N6-isopentenyl adenosine(37)-C2)-methylthiotransferase MiaB [candidate division Zixibacteria bacterium]
MNEVVKNNKFHITTFGCQMNLADSSTLVATLLTRGYQRVYEEKEADLIIFNTCSVREKAEERVFGRLWEVYKYKKEKPDLKIAVVGCMAQRLGEKLIEKVPHVDFVLGTDRLFELPEVARGNNGYHPVMTAFGHENMDAIKPVRENDFSGFVTISRGCDNYCTYCIVPYVRGRERAHSADSIVENVQRLADEGVVEIMLLGQNVNSYRWHDTDFPELLERVAAETDIRRIRYMTSHPKDLSNRLVDVMADNEKIMPHVHLPLQSGADRILERMGRKYTIEHYNKIVDYIRSRLDYVAVTTDLIVGFPSETEAEYEATLRAVSDIQFDSAFMFRYSVRPGTIAAEYDDDVPEADKIRRLNKLIDLQQKISFERNQRELGRVCYSLVEGFSRRSEEFSRARTEGNKIVLFKNGGAAPGTVVPVKITGADAFTLHGEIVEEVRC